MWFKNAKVYRLTQSLTLDEELLERALLEHHFRPCGKQDISTSGFQSPFAQARRKDGPMFHKVSDRFWFCLRKQERLLPSSVVNNELSQKVADIEAQTGAPVGKKAQQDLKQQIITTLLPQAFTKDSYTQGFVSVSTGLVVVEASSDSRAEAFLAMLRKVLGSLPVVPLVQSNVGVLLTDWLQTQTPPALALLDEAEFVADDDSGSSFKCKNQALDSDEVHTLLAAGKRVRQLSIAWEERLSCMVTDEGAFKKIRFTDILQDTLNDIPKEEKAARLDAEFALMSAELVAFIEYISTLILPSAAEG